MATDPNVMQAINIVRKKSSVVEDTVPKSDTDEAVALGYDIIEDLDTGAAYSSYPPALVEQTSV